MTGAKPTHANDRPPPVVAAVIRRAGAYLICQRPPEKRYGGLWEFPGGKLHEGESHAEGAARELDEELGLSVTGVGQVLFSRQDPGSGLQIDFLEVTADGEPEAREHQALKWVPANKLLTYALAPSDAEFARFLNSE